MEHTLQLVWIICAVILMVWNEKRIDRIRKETDKLTKPTRLTLDKDGHFTVGISDLYCKATRLGYEVDKLTGDQLATVCDLVMVERANQSKVAKCWNEWDGF